MHNYSIDMCLNISQSSSSFSVLSDGPLDLVLNHNFHNEKFMIEQHAKNCTCSLPVQSCLKFYRRYVNNGRTYHSLSYNKRGLCNSYAVQYSTDPLNSNPSFGDVVVFFQDKVNSYALINK